MIGFSDSVQISSQNSKASRWPEKLYGSIKKNYKASRWPVKIIKKLPRASIDSIKILFFSGARGAYL